MIESRDQTVVLVFENIGGAGQLECPEEPQGARLGEP